jgi:hypothetical protein
LNFSLQIHEKSKVNNETSGNDGKAVGKATIKPMGCVSSNPQDYIGYAKQLPDLMTISFCSAIEEMGFPN